MNKIVGAFFASLLVLDSACAGDEGDVYAYALFGRQVRTGVYEGTVAAGYCFWDSWGLAPVFDQMSDAYNVSIEGRYFFEPFETAVGLGMMSRRDRLQKVLYLPLFTGSASYLLALTPSLAFKFESKGQFLWEDKGTLNLAAGIRFLY